MGILPISQKIGCMTTHRLRLIKIYAKRHYDAALKINRAISKSRQKRGESNLWQRQYWAHWIRDEQDFATHCDYIHYNPEREAVR